MRNSIFRRPNDNSSQQKPIESSVSYPNSIIRQFLNMRRITKDKGCLIIFLLYCLALVVMMGIGFFYGNYSKLGVFVNDNAPVGSREVCSQYVNIDFTACVSTCDYFKFLGKVCLASNSTDYNPAFSTQVNGLLSMYDIKYTFNMITYVSAGLMVATAIIFILLIYISKIIYVLIAALFFMLLGMAFYLLKNVQIRILSHSIVTNSIFYSEQQNTRSISFVLLGLYLVIFPFILFSPKKIKLGTLIIQKLKEFYSSMSNMILFTLFSIAVVWGSLILQIFLIMHFYTAGTVSDTPQQSMFYTYQDISLSHPAALVFHFIGIFWLYSTLISWHKYFVSSAMCLWYFQDSQRLYPVRRGLRRSLNHLGSAALDGILMPLEWLLLLLYAILKTNDSEEQRPEQQQSSSCINGCFKSFRMFFMACYRSVNRTSPSSAVLTNYGYFESCQNSTEIFSLNSHRFFNIGGILTIFLTLFVCILWVIVIYFVIYAEIFVKQFPPLISSIVLPVFCVFIIGLVIGSIFSNIFTASLDCLLYCYLIEKKSLAEGVQLERKEEQLKIKKVLDQCYLRSAQEFNANIFIYEELDENTLDLTYVSTKQ